MDSSQFFHLFKNVSTPLIADACMRLGLPLRIAPHGISPLIPGSRMAGRVLPARHFGSVDIFLEAMESAEVGDILVIDNQGRQDEGCIGDLTVLEAQSSGLAGIALWGCHRDTAEILEIGFPVFSYGAWPAGPARLDSPSPRALSSASFGGVETSRADFACADDDGLLFVAEEHVEPVMTTAQAIWQTERRQAQAVQDGKTLRQQLRFNEYLVRRAADPTYTFRQHLRGQGGAIEE